MANDKERKVISSIDTGQGAAPPKEVRQVPSTSLLSGLLDDMSNEAEKERALIEEQLKAKEEAERRAQEEAEAKLRTELRGRLEEETHRRHEALDKIKRERRRKERAKQAVDAPAPEGATEEAPPVNIVSWIIPFAAVILLLAGGLAFLWTSPEDTGGDLRAFYSQVKAGKWMAVNHARNKQRELKLVDLTAEIAAMELKVSEADLESQTFKEKLENKKKELAAIEASFQEMKDEHAKKAANWKKIQDGKVKIDSSIFKLK